MPPVLKQLLGPSFLLLLVAACAPAAQGPRAQVDQLTEPISYYPQETGAVWQYLPDGAALSEGRVASRIDGPTLLGGEVLTAQRLVGRGIDTTYYRSYDDDGVLLHRETRPGAYIDYDPPLREFPAPGTLAEGVVWGGTTTASVRFPQARVDYNEDWDIRYQYEVVDERVVQVPAGEFEVFQIDFHSCVIEATEEAQGEEAGDDDAGRQTFDPELWADGPVDPCEPGGEIEVIEELTQSILFTPHVGEIRTENDFLLVAANFLLQDEEEAANDE